MSNIDTHDASRALWGERSGGGCGVEEVLMEGFGKVYESLRICAAGQCGGP
jgi:hypothetical protein